MILTTTNSVEGRKIIKYFDPVSKSVVLGTNAIADLGASFTDFFGGRSGNYESRLQSINENALEMLRKHCIKLKANAVVGVNMDIGEISGGGKNMLMVTVIGTPVVLDREHVKVTDGNTNDYHGIVNQRLRAKRIVESGKKLFHMSDDDIDFIVNTGFEEFLPLIKDGMVAFDLIDPTDRDRPERILKTILNVFDTMPSSLARDTLYSWISDYDIAYLSKGLISDCITNFDHIDYSKALDLTRSEDLIVQKHGLELLHQDKSIYSDSDIQTMNQLQGDGVTKFFEQAELREEKGIMGTKIRWGCSCGNKNSDKDTHCFCGRDRRGFFSEDITPEMVQKNINDKLSLFQEISKT